MKGAESSELKLDQGFFLTEPNKNINNKIKIMRDQNGIDLNVGMPVSYIKETNLNTDTDLYESKQIIEISSILELGSSMVTLSDGTAILPFKLVVI